MADTRSTDLRRFSSGSEERHVADRLFIGLILLLIVVAAAIVFLAAIGLFSLADALPFGRELERAVLFEHLPHGLGRLVSAATSALVGVIAAVLLLRRLFPGPAAPTARHVLVADDTGIVIVEKRGISTVASAALARVSGVVDARVQVIGSGGAPVRLVIRAWIHAGAELQRAGAEVRDKAKEAVEKLVGLDVHDVLVQIEVVPLEDLGRVVE